MRWANVRTIFCREVRDQVRDQRTLFMVFVLPILLYPILVMGMIQVRIAFEDKPREVILVGAQYLPETPALLNANRLPGVCSGQYSWRNEYSLITFVSESTTPRRQ